jgi:hypothetical protein
VSIVQTVPCVHTAISNILLSINEVHQELELFLCKILRSAPLETLEVALAPVFHLTLDQRWRKNWTSKLKEITATFSNDLDISQSPSFIGYLVTRSPLLTHLTLKRLGYTFRTANVFDVLAPVQRHDFPILRQLRLMGAWTLPLSEGIPMRAWRDLCSIDLCETVSSDPLFWLSLQAAQISLQNLHLHAFTKECLEYMCSYFGIQELILELYVKRNTPLSDLIRDFYLTVLPRHADSLHTLCLPRSAEWSLQQAFIPALSTCHQLRSMELGVNISPILNEPWSVRRRLLQDTETALLVSRPRTSQ